MNRQVKPKKRTIFSLFVLLFVIFNLFFYEFKHKDGKRMVDIQDHYEAIKRISIQNLQTGQMTEISSTDALQQYRDGLEPGSWFANRRQAKELKNNVTARTFSITFYIGEEAFFTETICTLTGPLENVVGLTFVSGGDVLTAEIDGGIYVSLPNYPKIEADFQNK